MIKAHRQFKKVYMHQILHILAASTYSCIERNFHSNLLSNMYQKLHYLPLSSFYLLFYKMLNSSSKGGGY